MWMCMSRVVCMCMCVCMQAAEGVLRHGGRRGRERVGPLRPRAHQRVRRGGHQEVHAHACTRIFQLMTPLHMYLKKLRKIFPNFPEKNKIENHHFKKLKIFI